jgi:hypothetical protein
VRKSVFLILSLSVVALVGCSSSGKPGASTTITAPKVSTGEVLPLTQDTTVAQTIDPCSLLTAPEASKLAGVAKVTRTLGGGTGSLLCVYAAGKSAGAEVTVKVDASPSEARNEFPSWVQPLQGTAKGLTRGSVPGLGDEATQTRNGAVNAGIFARRGAALVKIGAYPPPSLALLKAAAKTALSRITP